MMDKILKSAIAENIHLKDSQGKITKDSFDYIVRVNDLDVYPFVSFTLSKRPHKKDGKEMILGEYDYFSKAHDAADKDSGRKIENYLWVEMA